MTKPRQGGWRDRLAQWVEGVVDQLAGLVPVPPEPVPVRTGPRRPPPRR